MIEGGDYSVIKGNICKDNGTDGIILYNHADNNIVSNNQCSGNIDVGIMLEENNDDNTIIGNHCYNNDKDGILLFQSSHNIVEGNFCKDNGQDTLYSYSEIRIWGYSGVGSHHNLITNNKCRCTAATKCDYCIKEDLSIDDYNKITDNCVDGATTAQILTVGTHTVVHDNMGHNGVMDYGTF
jgi:parallel beta-helix repeat protein